MIKNGDITLRPLHIIMPMAGEGRRFADEGWTTPKPLIELHGLPLFVRAIKSVKPEGASMKYSFIVRQEHIDKFNIDREIKKLLPEAQVYSVEKTTRGAVETCLIAEKGIDDADGIIVMDCDLEFSSERYNRLIAESLSTRAEEAKGGVLVSFDSDLPRYSYAAVGDDGLVSHTAEKEVISNHALCGAYFFATGRDFKNAAHKLLNEPVMKKPEFYVSLLYNYLLQEKMPVKLAKMEDYRSYGTPEELKQWL